MAATSWFRHTVTEPAWTPTRTGVVTLRPETPAFAASVAHDGPVGSTASVASGSATTAGIQMRLGSKRLYHPNLVGVAFSPDGNTLVSFGNGYRVRLPGTGEEIARGRSTSSGPPALSADGRISGASGHRGEAVLTDLRTGQVVEMLRPDPLRTLQQPYGGLGDSPIAFSPDGELVACGHLNATSIWKRSTGEEVHRLELPSAESPTAVPAGREKFVAGLCFRADGRSLLDARSEAGLCVWNPSTGTLLGRYAGPRNLAAASGQNVAFSLASTVAASVDGRWIAVGGSDRRVAVMDAGSMQLERMLAGSASADRGRMAYWGGDHISTIVFHLASGRLAASSFEGDLWIWDLGSGRQTALRPDPHVCYLPDGARED